MCNYAQGALPPSLAPFGSVWSDGAPHAPVCYDASRMGIRMGYWDCLACGNKRIRGPDRQCSGCGQPRSPEVQFYTDESAPEVDDPELLKRAKSGADWHCPYCGADNPRGVTSCVGCGASAEGAKNRQERLILDQPKAPPPKPVKSAGRKALAIVLGVLGFVAFLAWFFVFRTSALAVEVEGKKWRKTIVVERLETQRHEDWDDAVPSGARRLGTTTKKKTVKVQDGTEKVKVGKKDLGNGLFEDVYEDKPRYVEREVSASWVTYEIDRWVQGRTLKEERTDGTEPPWPSFSPGLKERAGAKKSEIVLGLKGSDGKSYEYELDADRAGASGFQVGKSYTAQVNALGIIMDLK
jgi:hypothetical protein